MKREASKNIDAQILELEKITLDAAVEICRPHYKPNIVKLIEQDIRRKARSHIARVKDKDGVRTFFSNGKRIFINIETTEDINELKSVKRQLNNKYAPLNKNLKKVKKRRKEIDGQLFLFEENR